tara:strand:+ start:4187 stop:4963 length:777 start_codon:yes stop_codon:yes gene_type:complete
MVKRIKRNKYKKWFFILLFINVSYLTYQYVETPSLYYYFRSVLNQFFFSPKLPTGDYIYGIDISEYQGVIAWNKIHKINEEKTIDFVIVRATAGNNHRDRFFTSNWREAGNKKIIRGAYHYFRPNENSTEQANNFIKNVKLSSGDLPPIIDIERISKIQSINSLKVGVRNWMKIIEEHYGIKPILYTGAHYYKDYLAKDFNEYKLWVANYNQVNLPLKKHKWMMWQFSDNGSASGIKGPVDLNLFKGSKVELKKYALK